MEKTKKINTGEVPQYYVEESHEAIIHKKVYPYAVEKWDIWQEKRRVKMAERQTRKKEYESSSDGAVDTAEASNNCRVINFDVSEWRKAVKISKIILA